MIIISWVRSFGWDKVISFLPHNHSVGCPRSVIVKAKDYGIVVKASLYSSRCYYVHLSERYEPPYPPSYGFK